ncbi:MAG: C25 family cysteine peptidase [Thermoplasmatota archaeon]
MFRNLRKNQAVIGLVTILLLLSMNPANGIASTISSHSIDRNSYSATEMKQIEVDLSFSDPSVETYDEIFVVRVSETNYNWRNPGYPVIPAYSETFSLPFGSKIMNVSYDISDPEIIPVSGLLASGSYPSTDKDNMIQEPMYDPLVYQQDSLYPLDWVDIRTGGGLEFGEHKTFCVLRVYPVRYNPVQSHLQFSRNISVTILYEEPNKPVLQDPDIYDLLVIAPEKYHNTLEPLLTHKEKQGLKTRFESTAEIYDRMFWEGRDNAEKIKYFLKYAVEQWGVTYVLLVGGLDGQTAKWDIPIRLSHVVPPDEQEYAEQSFISDLYYADIYDSNGGFSSWDSNNDNVFSVWNESYHETMDLYPDVYLGRLPCRSKAEVRVLVNKILQYETQTSVQDSWFSNLVLVAGDAYADAMGFNEGELIAEKAIELMPDFNPVRVYARNNPKQDIDRKTVNTALNKGAGFAYFCGHGSVRSWSTHFPPDGKNWTAGYTVWDMMFLKNKNRYPVTVVGGCHNGQFDVTMMNIILGIMEDGLHYFSKEKGNWGDYWFSQWIPNCWAWWLTSKPGGGAIATIANTGLGTHGENDQDYNGIADYLEVLDGWLELRFLQLFGEEHQDILGENHGQTITEYLHQFLADDWKMDTKMVQQWELFGDPSLKIGGYN